VKVLITPIHRKLYLKSGVTSLAVKAEITGLYTALSVWELNEKGVAKKQAVPYECFLTSSEPTENTQRYWRAYGYEGRPNG